MKMNLVTKDCWIVGQIAGIRILERELADALKTPESASGGEILRRVEELNSWLNLVDDALTVWKPACTSGRVPTLPVPNSPSRMPAA